MRTGENIYKRKDGRYEARYIKSYNNGKAQYGYLYDKNYSGVKQKLQIMLARQLKPSESYKTDTIITFEELLNKWLQIKRVNFKESTYVKYLNMFRKHIIPQLGHYPLNMLTTALLEQFVADCLTCGRNNKSKGMAPKTVNDLLSLIKAIISYGREMDLYIPCHPKAIIVRNPVKEMRVLSSAEQNALVQFLLLEPDLFKLGTLLALYTGIRLGELCALQWTDFDFHNEILKVNKTIQRIQNISREDVARTRVVITIPKSRCSIRDIPIPCFLIPLLQKKQPYNLHFYFLSGEKNNYIEPRTTQNRFKGYMQQLGLNDVTFHTLRHTFATRCVEVDFEIKTLSEILGHSTVNITLNRYVHSSMQLKKNNMNKLSLNI